MGRIQMYQEGLGKEVKFLGRVTTLGGDRFIITVPKEDVSKIKDLKGRRVFVTVKEAKEE
jgi:ABC-type nitrate/sulfonate/bicarbonate transport system substrate-binding protein